MGTVKEVEWEGDRMEMGKRWTWEGDMDGDRMGLGWVGVGWGQDGNRDEWERDGYGNGIWMGRGWGWGGDVEGDRMEMGSG